MIKFFKYNNSIAAALLLGCFFMCSCENEIKKVQDLGKKQIGVEEGKTIESYLSQGGKMRAKLTAPTMLRYLYDTPKVVFPNTMHVDFYDSLTTVESQLNSKYGRYLETENKVFLKDSVVVFNRKGDTLWTNELYWDQNQAKFYTDKRVRIKKAFGEQYFNGIGMWSNQSFTDIHINNLQPDSYINVADSTY